jgi:6-phosphogluconate dehydrogenase
MSERTIRRTDRPMRIGMIGLGRMGSDLVRRLQRAGHECVVYDVAEGAAAALEEEGAEAADSPADLVGRLPSPTVVWIMVPASAVEEVLASLADLLESGDIVVDGGNSFYRDDIERSRRLGEAGIHFVDCGTSGGVWGLDRGYSLMIGGEQEVVEYLDPIFASIAPGRDAAEPTPNRAAGGTAPDGYYHCGPAGAGHFVKMVHNGVEYGMMAAIAEGIAVLAGADAGLTDRPHDAETAPLHHPEAYRYRFDLAEVAEVWRRGTVISSWLIDLAADALAADPDLSGYGGRVSDSGEGRWTAIAAIEEAVPAPVITAAVQERFSSRGLGRFADRMLSAMRREFGGHRERSG